MIDAAAVLGLAAVLMGASGALWHRLGKLEESVKRLPCRDRTDCPAEGGEKE